MISIDGINDLQNKSAAKDRIIAVLRQTVKQWVNEYNTLDACIEIQSAKIRELKAEIQNLNNYISGCKQDSEVIQDAQTKNRDITLLKAYKEGHKIPLYDLSLEIDISTTCLKNFFNGVNIRDRNRKKIDSFLEKIKKGELCKK